VCSGQGRQRYDSVRGEQAETNEKFYSEERKSLEKLGGWGVGGAPQKKSQKHPPKPKPGLQLHFMQEHGSSDPYALFLCS